RKSPVQCECNGTILVSRNGMFEQAPRRQGLRLARSIVHLMFLILSVTLILRWRFAIPSATIYQRSSEILTLTGGLIWITYSLSDKVAKAMDRLFRFAWLRSSGAHLVATLCAVIAFFSADIV